MRLLKQLSLYIFLFFIVPTQLLWAVKSSKIDEKAHLTISAGKNGVICSKSLQNCLIQVSQLQCLPTPGTVIITNNSRVPANNIQASSSNGFFSLYVLQNNSCPASLLPGRSCAISFFTNTSVVFLIPSVMVKGTNTNATFFDMQAIQCAPSQTTISAPTNAVIPTNDSVGVDITVNNLTSIPALNVRVNLPAFWTNVTSTTCAVIPANGSCVINIASTALTPFAPRGGISITGDNVISPPTIALAFSIDGFLIYSVVSNFAHVIANTDFNFPGSWSIGYTEIPGINETSTNPPSFCNGATDGFCNTSIITSFDPMAIAAGSCYLETTPQNTWYLPSICELGITGSAGCPANTESIFNLFSLGFTAGLTGSYWSSTQSSANPPNNAWFLNFNSMGAQGIADKSVSFNIRCARSILLS
ncbi:DUF1566 domain-containing protein [Legionella parisiensis]|uniref:DUF1566 domain-containing protein n=1 Tax=Legionella parisiensis TaxID=45071 RepID=A0A1E5JRL0_9GAMM|nr:DUF1566 domain-containing protein [Legionella parisiensis]KTD42797.1 hypothetical protein Lpar_0774 [Legionella parisiensis]OEH47167.1 hypothetical protein lpari_01942 [Legionella parisiensis]STX71523.1 Uncharacterised protein [Legionella parisiensis]